MKEEMITCEEISQAIKSKEYYITRKASYNLLWVRDTLIAGYVKKTDTMIYYLPFFDEIKSTKVIKLIKPAIADKGGKR